MRAMIYAALAGVSFALALAGCTTKPKPPADHPPRSGMMRDHMQGPFAKLDLTADQQARIGDIMKKNRAEVHKLMESAQENGDSKQYRKAIAAVHEKTRDDINAVLTDAQEAKLKEMFKKHRSGPEDGCRGCPCPRQGPKGGCEGCPRSPQRGHKGGCEGCPRSPQRGPEGEWQGRPQPPHPGMMLDHMKKGLDGLGLTADQKARIDTAVDNAKAKLEALHKEGRDQDKAQREKARAIFEDLHKTVDATMTPEQKEKLKKMHDQYRRGGHGRRPPPPPRDE